MNKKLLIWNIVLTVLILMVVLSGCMSTDSRVDWLVTQVQSQATEIAQLQATVNQNSQTIQTQTVQLIALQQYMQTSLQQLQQYIQAYMGSR